MSKIVVEAKSSHFSLYLIGSAAHNRSNCPQDVDVLIVNIEELTAQHESQIEKLVTCLTEGIPLDGTFRSIDGSLEQHLRDIFTRMKAEHPRTPIDFSFGFGPVRGEMDIPTDGIHFHICGPITRGDLEVIRLKMPFHAATFLSDSERLLGPELSQVLSPVSPNLEQLRFWDRISLRRVVNAKSFLQVRKGLRRMLRDRTYVLGYDRENALLVRQAIAALESGSTSEMIRVSHELAGFVPERPRRSS